jgi:hypothetical protein
MCDGVLLWDAYNLYCVAGLKGLATIVRVVMCRAVVGLC